MKSPHSFFLINISLVLSLFLINLEIGYYIFIASVFLVFLQLLFVKKKSFSSSKNDNIYKYLLVFNIIIVLSYMFNIGNIEYVSQIFTVISGDSPKYLYLKLVSKGIIYTFVIFSAFIAGKTLFSDFDSFHKLCSLLFVIFFINAFTDVITWLIETNGQIGRYNFLPPITGSAGISIHFSSIGFILGLAVVKNENNFVIKYIYRFFLFVLFMGVLIILTRKSQILFLMMYFLYNNLKPRRKKVSKLLIPVLILIVLSILITYIQNFEAFDSYSGFLSKESQDIEMRVAMFSSAVELFLNNPVWGIGYGMFVGHNLTPVFNNDLVIYLGSPHNGFAAILCELGLIGIVLYILMNLTIIKTLYNAQIFFKTKKSNRVYYFIATYVVILGSSISFFYSNSILFGPPNELTYINIAYFNFILIGAVVGNKSNYTK